MVGPLVRASGKPSTEDVPLGVDLKRPGSVQRSLVAQAWNLLQTCSVGAYHCAQEVEVRVDDASHPLRLRLLDGGLRCQREHACVLGLLTRDR